LPLILSLSKDEREEKNMATRVLVAYASKYGATREIAEKIGEVLKQEGLAADVMPAKDVKSLAGYSGVVIGAAMYMGMWRKEATSFVKKNEAALAEIKVWVFSTGPSGNGDPAELLKGIIVPRGVKPLLDRIKPRDITVFGGSLNTEKMNAFEKWIVKRVGGSLGDFRDWEAINKWAKEIVVNLKK
jgi:menaquinone-dependent protoporphyrinogen oxidase